MSQLVLATNKKPHICPLCQKSFSSTHQLAQHNRVHSGEKPYACIYCEKKFKQLSHLQQHTRLHTGKLIGKYIQLIFLKTFFQFFIQVNDHTNVIVAGHLFNYPIFSSTWKHTNHPIRLKWKNRRNISTVLIAVKDLKDKILYFIIKQR